MTEATDILEAAASFFKLRFLPSHLLHQVL